MWTPVYPMDGPPEAGRTAPWKASAFPTFYSLDERLTVRTSSFDVATAAQASLGAAAAAAAALWHLRTGQQQAVQVDRTQAALECTGYFALDAQLPAIA